MVIAAVVVIVVVMIVVAPAAVVVPLIPTIAATSAASAATTPMTAAEEAAVVAAAADVAHDPGLTTVVAVPGLAATPEDDPDRDQPGSHDHQKDHDRHENLAPGENWILV